MPRSTLARLEALEVKAAQQRAAVEAAKEQQASAAIERAFTLDTKSWERLYARLGKLLSGGK